MAILTVPQQRARDAVWLMTEAGLEAHLCLLIDEALTGNMASLALFQQDLQYASPELKTKLLERIRQPSSA
jgi:hypothetical protein